MSRELRYYQIEAINAIDHELITKNESKCVVKMFCGTGKSIVMRRCNVVENKNLVVYVFPSLQLVDQFYIDYLHDFPTENILRICSEVESTTDPVIIQNFVSKNVNKIICVTYQSYKTLIDNLEQTIIDVCLYDESHHVVGLKAQEVIFSEYTHCYKQIFFTATPKNSNQIVMNDIYNEQNNSCGKLVYDYTYLNGLNDCYLNPIEIRIDMYTSNTNKSIFESIARSILASSNNRVLTFHSDVNTERETSVKNFVNQTKFIESFRKVQKEEFIEVTKYKKIKMIALSADIKAKCEICMAKCRSNTYRVCGKKCCRFDILNMFDQTPNDEIIVLSSCETIGEGIDTKNANHIVFVDSKTSFVKIIQNIGRIVRPSNLDPKPDHTILIPCWVDKTKYLECEGNKEKCDEIIRNNMNENGNFNGILNVFAALKQEDEELFEACMHYPYDFAKIDSEIDSVFDAEFDTEIDTEFDIDSNTSITTREQLIQTLEDAIGCEIVSEDYKECETNEELIQNVAIDNNITIDILNMNDNENFESIYNAGCENIVKLQKLQNNMYKTFDTTPAKPKNKHKINVNIHTNDDIKILWNVTNNIDILNNITSCVLDCEVIDMWYDKLDKLKEFIDINKRRPSSTAKKADEKQIGQWLGTQIQNYKKHKQSMADEKKRVMFEQFMNDYSEYFISNDEKWDAQFNDLKNFIDTNKRRPSGDSKNDNEKQIGGWLGNQIKNYKQHKQSMADEKKRVMFEQFMNDYSEYFVSIDDKFNAQFNELKNFINTNKRRPTHHSKNVDEKQIGLWLGTQITNYKQHKKSMADQTKRAKFEQFMNDYAEYFVSNDDKWDAQFNELKNFIDTNKRRPSGKSKNVDEKQIGLWLGTQITNYKQHKYSMTDETKRTKFEQFMNDYAEYFVSNDDKFNAQFNDLKNFINTNKRRPSHGSKNVDEKQIGIWLSHQIENYKQNKYSMTDQTKSDIFKQFILEYAEYFPNIDSTTDAITDSQSDTTPKTTPKTKSTKLTKTTRASQQLQLQQPQPQTESIEHKKQRINSELSQLLQKYKTMSSHNLNKKFKNEPHLWHKFHEISESNNSLFDPNDVPYMQIINELNKITTQNKIKIVDMGCGLRKISKYFQSLNDPRFEFYNYDHIACDEFVTSCDIMCIPHDENTITTCILSLAMWGSNCSEYILEAYRVLELFGRLYIIEPTLRWSEKDEFNNILPNKEASKLIQLLEQNNFKIINSKIDKYCLFVCVKI